MRSIEQYAYSARAHFMNMEALTFLTVTNG